MSGTNKTLEMAAKLVDALDMLLSTTYEPVAEDHWKCQECGTEFRVSADKLHFPCAGCFHKAEEVREEWREFCAERRGR